jgi:hypothetical protein
MFLVNAYKKLLLNNRLVTHYLKGGNPYGRKET